MSENDTGRVDILQRLDEIHDELASLEEDLSINLMLRYTHQLHQLWRPLLKVIPVPEGGRLLDVGTGSGLVPLELATSRSLDALGIDIEPAYVRFAERFGAALREAGLLHETSNAEFAVGDFAKLSLEPQSFDVLLVREVLQFVADPQAACDLLFQAAKPGAIVCLSDLDDQLFLSYPEHSDAFIRIYGAVQNVQKGQGGDREIGRKLSTLLSRSGFAIQSVLAIPQARHFVETADDAERLFVIEQMKEARERVVASGELSGEEFDSLIREVEREPQSERFRFNARLVAIARKPES